MDRWIWSALKTVGGVRGEKNLLESPGGILSFKLPLKVFFVEEKKINLAPRWVEILKFLVVLWGLIFTLELVQLCIIVPQGPRSHFGVLLVII